MQLSSSILSMGHVSRLLLLQLLITARFRFEGSRINALTADPSSPTSPTSPMGPGHTMTANDHGQPAGGTGMGALQIGLQRPAAGPQVGQPGMNLNNTFGSTTGGGAFEGAAVARASGQISNAGGVGQPMSAEHYTDIYGGHEKTIQDQKQSNKMNTVYDPASKVNQPITMRCACLQ